MFARDASQAIADYALQESLKITVARGYAVKEFQPQRAITIRSRRCHLRQIIFTAMLPDPAGVKV